MLTNAHTPIRMPFKTRIAPSPTGRMHAGNVFAALMSWLIARKNGGEVLLRIEDLDSGRSRIEYVDHIMRDLDWLGLDWVNDVIYQSTRSDAYSAALSILETQHLVYPCFCSRADLHAASAPHTSDGDLVYTGTCRHLTEKERDLQLRSRKPAQRVKVSTKNSETNIITFHDQLQGMVTCDLDTSCGDFIVRRSDGIFAYQLAVTVDDIEQGITCLVRGCDLLESTPRQLYLRRLLTKQAPDTSTDLSFYHLPLLVGSDGRRLSKRNGDCDLEHLRAQYKTPTALLGHIAHITGIVPGPDEPHSLDEILECYSLDQLKLRWIIEYR